MNKAMLAVGIIILSLIALLMVNVLTNFSTGGEFDYYTVKETVDAAMNDSIDRVFLRTCGLYRIDKERFVENFIIRFAKTCDATRGYDIKFYDINEVPPKVSVSIDSLTVLSVKSDDNPQSATINTNYDAILETEYYSDLEVEGPMKNTIPDLMDYDRCLSYLKSQAK